jgi:hypothetical protein
LRRYSARSRGPKRGPVVRWKAKMLLVPYSSIDCTMFLRIPVRIDEITMTTLTPITTPTTVRKLRSL